MPVGVSCLCHYDDMLPIGHDNLTHTHTHNMLPTGPVSLTHTYKRGECAAGALRHPVPCQRIIAAYAALNARMTGTALIPGLTVPTADARAMDAM